jgi:hypothetical protein
MPVSATAIVTQSRLSSCSCRASQQIQQRLPQTHLMGMQRPDCIVTIDPVRPRETKTARLTRELSEALKQQAATAVIGFLAAVRARQAATMLPRRRVT